MMIVNMLLSETMCGCVLATNNRVSYNSFEADRCVTLWVYGPIYFLHIDYGTGPDDTGVMPSANGLVYSGFVSRYRLQPGTGF